MQQVMKPRTKGFTLLEILIVLTILGTLAMVVIPTFSSHEDEQKLSGAVTELSTALRFARNDAIHSGDKRMVKINKNINSFQVIDFTPPTSTIYHPSSKKPYALDYDDSYMYEGVNITGTGTVNIIFDINGLASNSSVITMTYGKSSVDVQVDIATGYVIVN